MHPIESSLRDLFPAGVAVHAAAYDEQGPPQGAVIPPSLASSVPKRRAEFIAGRACARAALDATGCTARDAIGIGAMRAPVWPAGFVGSISHAAGLAAAVAAPSLVALSLGLDLERVVSQEQVETLSPSVATVGEMARVRPLMADPRLTFTAIFAAKEALFKCVAPLVGCYFDFLDAEVERALDGQLSLRLKIALGPAFQAGRVIEVRLARAMGFVVAGAALEATR